MATLFVYGDESGTDSSSAIVAVGGYVSSVSLWEGFQREWKQLLADERLGDVFHTSDLLSRRGAFTAESGWDDERVIRVMEWADSIIAKYTLFGVVAYTETQECERVFPLKDQNGTRKKYSAEYLISGTQLAWGISQWARENDYTEPVEYVFEAGANGSDYLLKALVAARENGESLIGNVAFEDKSTVQLQSADKLVQQSRRAISRHLSGRETDRLANRLIKAKLGKVYRLDRDNLSLLRARAESLLKRETES
jgi:hypothetical protein